MCLQDCYIKYISDSDSQAKQFECLLARLPQGIQHKAGISQHSVKEWMSDWTGEHMKNEHTECQEYTALSHSPGTRSGKPAHSSISVLVRQCGQTAAWLEFPTGNTVGLGQDLWHRRGFIEERVGKSFPWLSGIGL